LAKTGGTIATGSSAGSDQPAETTPRLPALNHDLTKRITRRYKAEVAKVEKERLETFVPLHQRDTSGLDNYDMARSVKSEMEMLSKKAGSQAVPWDSILSADPLVKKMQFLSNHASSTAYEEELQKDAPYTGEFMYGLRHGAGKSEHGGEVYQGGWLWDARHGQGTLTHKDGSKTTGEWKAGKLDGRAVTHGQAGNVIFDGEYKEGKRQGIGRYVIPDSGDVYEGGWQGGRMHGRGVYHFSNGDKLVGMWKEGRYDGAAMIHYSDGSVSRRVYKDGVLVTTQDYDLEDQKFGKELNRDVVQKHTALWQMTAHASAH